MAILDFLKNKKEKDKAKEKKAQKVSVAGKPDKSQKHFDGPASMPAKQALGGFSYDVVKEPHISEKSTQLGASNKYVFRIAAGANKLQIRKAIEGIYNVNVIGISTITIPHKKRRLGRTEGFKKAYHKAVVTIKEGQKIELF